MIYFGSKILLHYRCTRTKYRLIFFVAKSRGETKLRLGRRGVIRPLHSFWLTKVALRIFFAPLLVNFNRGTIRQKPKLDGHRILENDVGSVDKKIFRYLKLQFKTYVQGHERCRKAFVVHFWKVYVLFFTIGRYLLRLI